MPQGWAYYKDFYGGYAGLGRLFIAGRCRKYYGAFSQLLQGVIIIIMSNYVIIILTNYTRPVV